jgi:PAS domain S-box-containing protein
MFKPAMDAAYPGTRLSEGRGSNKSLTLRTITLAVGGIAVSMGLLVLIGWAFDLEELKRVLSGVPAMRPNTAISFILLGAALILLQTPATLSRRIARGCVILGAAISILTLTEHLLGLNLGIEDFGFRDRLTSVAIPPVSRMVENTALGFVLLSLALGLLNERRAIANRYLISGGLSLGVVALGFFALFGAMVEQPDLYWWGRLTTIAPLTAGLFISFGLSLLSLSWSQAHLRWIISGWLTAGFLCALMILVTAAAFSQRRAVELVGAFNWVEHTHKVLTKVRELRGALDESQSGMRGYVITGSEGYLPLSNEAIPQAWKSFEELLKLTSDNASQQVRLAQLKKQIAEYVEIERQTIDLRRRTGFEAAEQMIAAGTDKGLMDRIRRGLEDMETEEHRLMTLRDARSKDITEMTLTILPVGAVLSLLLITIMLFRLNSEAAQRLKTSNSLKQSEEFNRRVLESSQDRIEVLDLTGNLISLNEDGDRHPEIRDSTPYGKRSWIGVWRAEDQPRARAALETACEGGMGRFQAFSGSETGNPGSWDVIVTPIRGTDGHVQRLLSISRDILRQREAEEALQKSERYFRGLADAMPQIVWAADPDGSIDYYNKRWFDYTGTTYKPNEAWTQAQLLHPDDVQKCSRSWTQAFTTGEPYQTEYRLKRASDGTYRWHLGRALALRNDAGQIVRWFGTSTDINDQKQAETEIHELNGTLEQRVTERTSQLEAANKEMEAFSYSVSHDLRAPLRAINGFAGIVLEEFSSQVPEKGREYLERVRAGGKRMGELIDDLLAFSRLSRQSVNRRTVNSDEIVQNVLEELKPQHEDREIEWQIKDLPSCEGDPVLLKQVWVNLLSNAVKYTRGREPASVEIGCTCENGENIFFVRDNGAGFDMQYSNKLFGVFQRLHRSDEFEGTGVGLAIVRRVVQRHGGRVWAEAAVNRGATFYFTLQEGNKHERKFS